LNAQRIGGHCLIVLAAAACGTGRAADWRIEPRVVLGEMATDNVTLAPSGQEKSDFVTQVDPGVSIDGRAARLKVHVDYTMQNLLYASHSDFDRTNHLVDSYAKAELAPGWMFLDAKANLRRDSISLLGPANPENLNAVGNQADVRSYLLSPYLGHVFGTYGKGELRYAYSRVDSNAQGGLYDTQNNRVSGQFDSGEAYRDVLFGASAYKSRTTYGNASPATDATREQLRGGIRVLPHVFLIADAGYESNSYTAAGPTSGALWDLGARWEPSKLTSLEATAGHRYFGTTFALRFDHRSRLMYWNANYSEDLATTATAYAAPASQATVSFFDNLLKTQIEDDGVRAAYVRDLLQRNRFLATQFGTNAFLSNQTYLEKHFEASWGLSSGRSTAMVNLYDVVRQAQASGASVASIVGPSDFSASATIRTQGIGAYFTTRLGPLLSANAGANLSRYEFSDVGRTDNVTAFSAGLARQFTPRIYGTVDVRRAARSSSLAAAEYHEDSVRAALTLLY
jgi:uncharacterized protein (PEP-CTERM system associated)